MRAASLPALALLLAACFGDGVSLYPHAHPNGELSSHDAGDGDGGAPDGEPGPVPADAAVDAAHDAGPRQETAVEPDADVPESPEPDAGPAEPQPVELTVSVSGAGDLHSADELYSCVPAQSPCTWLVPREKVLSILARPAAKSRFSGWGDACAGAQNTQCSLVMRGPGSVRASFEPATAMLHTLVEGPGEITGGPITCSADSHACDATVSSGEQVTLTAHAISNSQFAGWTGDCAAQEQATTCTLTLDAAKTVGARFVPRFILSVLLQNGEGCASGSGSVSADLGDLHCEIPGSALTSTSQCSATFLAGSTVTLTFTPGTYTRFSGWADACSGKSATCQVQMDRDRSVAAAVCGMIQ